MTSPKKLPPVHPGKVLNEDFLKELSLTPNALAVAIKVPAPRIYALVKGTRAFTADTAMRLGKYLGTSAQFWMNLQARYDLDLAEDQLAEELATIRPFKADDRGPGVATKANARRAAAG